MTCLRILLVAPLGLTLLTTACDSKPCSGGGMQVDKRPLPEAWQASAPAIAAAVACNSEDGLTDSEWSRSYELGANAEDGKKQWTAHLTAKGWETTAEGRDDETYRAATFAKDGHKLEVKCSRMVDDKGWCTLLFTPKPA